MITTTHTLELTSTLQEIYHLLPDFLKPVKSVKSISLLVLASLLTQRIKKESDTATLILLRKAFILCNEIATEIVGNTKQGLIYWLFAKLGWKFNFGLTLLFYVILKLSYSLKRKCHC